MLLYSQNKTRRTIDAFKSSQNSYPVTCHKIPPYTVRTVLELVLKHEVTKVYRWVDYICTHSKPEQ
jgi:hypothetical protein